MKKLMVLVAALALVAGSAMTAAAADWNFYGHARVATFVTDSEEQGPAISTITGLPKEDTTNYNQGLQGNARIGATVKVSDELTGGFEYGTGVNVRKLYGEWNFGPGTLLVGQTYTPLNYFYSNQVYETDNDMLAQGGVYSGREAMIRLKFGGFEIAAIDPYDSEATDAGLDTETSFPAVEANYNLVMDLFSMNLGAGYQTYEIIDPALGDQDVDSWIVALGARTEVGPAYIGGNAYFGENVGNIIAVSLEGDSAWDDGYASYNPVTGKVEDNEGWGYIIAAGFKANDMFSFEAGYGYAEAEEYDFGTLTHQDNEVQTYYLQSTITLAPGVFITPEVGMIDGEENVSGSYETMYYGAKWQINF